LMVIILSFPVFEIIYHPKSSILLITNPEKPIIPSIKMLFPTLVIVAIVF
jgi:hypothetical protein